MQVCGPRIHGAATIAVSGGARRLVQLLVELHCTIERRLGLVLGTCKGGGRQQGGAHCTAKVDVHLEVRRPLGRVVSRVLKGHVHFRVHADHRLPGDGATAEAAHRLAVLSHLKPRSWRGAVHVAALLGHLGTRACRRAACTTRHILRPSTAESASHGFGIQATTKARSRSRGAARVRVVMHHDARARARRRTRVTADLTVRVFAVLRMSHAHLCNRDKVRTHRAGRWR